MAGSLTKTETCYHSRSISLPQSSHPITVRIVEELNKLKTWKQPSSTSASTASTLNSETVCAGLSGLGELYEWVEDLLHLPLTQQALVQHRQHKWVGEVLDGSLRLLDVCGTTRDILLQMKERVGDLQSGLRRKAKNSSIGSNISAYICARKKIKKDIAKGLEALKRMDNKFGSSLLLGVDQHLSTVARLLREVCAITISIFRSLLSFIYVPMSKLKPSGWSLVSKLMHKGLVECEGEEDNSNEVDSVDVVLRALCTCKEVEVERRQSAQKKLMALEVSIEGLEDGLERMFKRLIQTRVSLLNIFTS